MTGGDDTTGGAGQAEGRAGAAGGAADGFGGRLTAALDRLGPVCPGIDPHPALLEAWGLGVTAGGAREFGYRVVEAAHGRCGVVKPQVAFFERYGSAGYAALEDVLARCRDAGLLVVADAKRGDIGSSSEGYADAWLDPASPLACDAVTASPYLGPGSLDPLVRRAVATGRGVVVLAVTSNPEGALVQLARPVGHGEPSVAAAVADWAARWNAASPGTGAPPAASRHGTGPVGLVVGLTSLDVLAASGAGLEGFGGPLLVPGLGAQGGAAGDLARLPRSVARATVVAVGRDLLRHGPSPAALAAALEPLITDTRQALHP